MTLKIIRNAILMREIEKPDCDTTKTLLVRLAIVFAAWVATIIVIY